VEGVHHWFLSNLKILQVSHLTVKSSILFEQRGGLRWGAGMLHGVDSVLVAHRVISVVWLGRCAPSREWLLMLMVSMCKHWQGLRVERLGVRRVELLLLRGFAAAPGIRVAGVRVEDTALLMLMNLFMLRGVP